MAGVTIRYDADPADALDGSAQVEDALDGLDGKLGDVADSGKAAASDLGDALGGVGDSAGEATDGLDDVAEGTEGAGVNARSMGSVFKQVLEGDIAGAARAAVPLLSALGPAAAIAGVVAFAGLTIITSALGDQNEATKKLKANLATLYTDAIKSGRDYLDQAAIISEAQDVLLNPDRRDEYNRAQADALKLGIDTNTVLLAQAGDQAALNVVLQAAADKQDAYAAKVAASTSKLAEAGAAKTQEARDITDLTTKYGALADEHATLGENAKHAAELAAQAEKSQRDQIDKTSQAEQDRYEGIAQRVASLNGKRVTIPSTIEAPNVARLLARAQSDIDHRPDLVVKVGLKTPFSRVNP